MIINLETATPYEILRIVDGVRAADRMLVGAYASAIERAQVYRREIAKRLDAPAPERLRAAPFGVYSDIKSDGGMDPRNRADLLATHVWQEMTDSCVYCGDGHEATTRPCPRPR